MPLVVNRKKTRRIKVGTIPVGGMAPIAVQSMTNTPTSDVNATVSQIQRLQNAGCEIIRVAVPDGQAANAISAIKPKISIPLIADIHFDHQLAIAAARVARREAADSVESDQADRRSGAGRRVEFDQHVVRGSASAQASSPSSLGAVENSEPPHVPQMSRRLRLGPRLFVRRR